MPERAGRGSGEPYATILRGCEVPVIGLILDMDGVIIDSNPVHREAWAAYNRRFGIPTDAAMLSRMYGRRNDDIVRDYFGASLTDEEVAAHGRAKEALYRALMAPRIESSLVPGVREFVARHHELPIAVATNAETANVDFVLGAAGLGQHLRAVLTGSHVSRPKPDPEIYLRAAAELGVDPCACIVFEDSLSGIQAARAARMRVVGLRTTHAELPGVDLAVNDFLDPELEVWLGEQLRG